MANNSRPTQFAYDGFVKRGFTPPQAAALAGHMQRESDGNPVAWNAKEGAGGLLQWRLDRLTGLENYAQTTGRNPADPETQLDFVVHEMKGPEAKSAAAFLGASDVQSASAALKQYIRYGDNSDDTRLNYALGYAGEQPQNAAVAAAAQVGAGGNIAPSSNVAQAFVNPAFPDAMAPTAPPAAPPSVAPSAPVSSAAVPAATGPSDDELLGQWSAAPTVASPDMQAAAPTVNSDDDLLGQWTQPSPAPQQPQAEPAPSAAPTTDQPSFIDQAKSIAGKVVDAIPIIGPANKLMLQPAAPDASGNDLTGYQPSSVPFLDPINAFASKAVDKIPVIGAGLNSLGNKFDAAIASLVEGKPVTPEDRAAVNAADQARFPNAAMAGEIAGTVVPLIAGGSTVLGGKLLGTTGNALMRTGMSAASSGVIGGADTLARGGSVEDAGKNALTSAAVGGAVPLVGGAIGAGFNKLLGGTSSEVAKLAQLARDKFNIPIGPGQISENPMVRVADSVVAKMPFSGGTVSNAAQQGAFNRAVANTMGEKASALTPDVMASAKNRIGGVFDSVAQRTPSISADSKFVQDMIDTTHGAEQTLTADELGPIGKQVGAILDKFEASGNRTITGDIYQALTRKDAPLSRAMQSDNPNIRFYAGQIRDALDGALERAAPADALADLKTARSQWRAMRTVEDLTEKAPTGDISPALLMGAVRKSYGDMAFGGGGDLADLARIGQQFLKAPPSSGTAERLAIMKGLGLTGGGLAGVGGLLMNPATIPMAAAVGIPSAAGFLAASKGAGALMRSDALANKLISNSIGARVNPGQLTTPNMLMRIAPPAVMQQDNKLLPNGKRAAN